MPVNKTWWAGAFWDGSIYSRVRRKAAGKHDVTHMHTPLSSQHEIVVNILGKSLIPPRHTKLSKYFITLSAYTDETSTCNCTAYT